MINYWKSRYWQVAVILMLLTWSASDLAAGKMAELLNTEGYFVKLPSGDIYLFPKGEKDFISGEKSKAFDGSSVSKTTNRYSHNEGQVRGSSHPGSRPNWRRRIAPGYAEVPLWKRRMNYWRQRQSVPPPPAPGNSFRYSPGRRFYYNRPIYLPRFDAAKSLKSKQK